jgi:RNA polymerase sigma-70 factor (ECF subfamily)
MSQVLCSPVKDDDFLDKVQPHLGCLVCRALRILGSEDLAWDAVQEALLTLWRAENTPDQVRGWLLRSVTHRSLHLRRTHGRRRKHEEGAAAQRRECDCRDPAHALADRELHAGLDDAIARLPEDYRRVFRLREVEGLDYHTIAAQLRIPLGTVQSRLNRARSALRMLLGPTFQAAHDCWLCGSRDHAAERCPNRSLAEN